MIRLPPEVPTSFATLEDFEHSELWAWMCGEIDAGRARIENVRIRSESARPVERFTFIGCPPEEP